MNSIQTPCCEDRFKIYIFFLEEHKNASYLFFALKLTLPNIKGSLGNKNITSDQESENYNKHE